MASSVQRTLLYDHRNIEKDRNVKNIAIVFASGVYTNTIMFV